jgi:hypothetical protein
MSRRAVVEGFLRQISKSGKRPGSNFGSNGPSPKSAIAGVAGIITLAGAGMALTSSLFNGAWQFKGFDTVKGSDSVGGSDLTQLLI